MPGERIELLPGGAMKKSLVLLLISTAMFCVSFAAAPPRQPAFNLSLVAGIPVKILPGRYDADFGYLLLALAGQVRISENFFGECLFAYYPDPRPGDKYSYNDDGYEIELNGVWKLAITEKVNPFVKFGLSYAWINYNNAYLEMYYPNAGREKSKYAGLNAGAGIEYNLSEKLLLRLGGTLTLVPFENEGSFSTWLKFFAGLGFRF
jgi:hypothetical protein